MTGQILSNHDFVRVIFDLESLQQYGRRNSLRFHNVPMNSDNIQGTDGLVLKVCKDHLGVELKIDDIDQSHIIGNITNGKGQIICRLRNWKIKNKIYSNKSSLKNNPDKIVITEDLTRHRQYLVQKLNQARKSRLINSFWTRDGRIFAKKKLTHQCLVYYQSSWVHYGSEESFFSHIVEEILNRFLMNLFYCSSFY
jgi:hypothetical protein